MKYDILRLTLADGSWEMDCRDRIVVIRRDQIAFATKQSRLADGSDQFTRIVLVTGSYLDVREAVCEIFPTN